MSAVVFGFIWVLFKHLVLMLGFESTLRAQWWIFSVLFSPGLEQKHFSQGTTVRPCHLVKNLSADVG